MGFSGGGGAAGTAGGDLTGNYPNPAVGAQKVTADKMGSGASIAGLVAESDGAGGVTWSAGGTYAGSYPIVDADIAAGAAILRSKLNFGAGLTNADIAVAAAIAYSKLTLTNAVVNGDIAAAAAIARSKLDFGAGLVNADLAAAAAIVYSKLVLTNSIVNADIAAAAAIVYSKLNLAASIVNGDIAGGAAITYSKLSLALSIVNGDVANAAAIAYSKLALTNSIVNGDIGAAAAIAYSKLNLAFDRVRVVNSATQSLATGVLTAITFDTETYDTNAMHSTSSNTSRLTCKTAGLYNYFACLAFAANAVGNRQVAVILNGATYLQTQQQPNCGAVVSPQVSIAGQIALVVNDYIEVQGAQDSGGNLNVLTNTYTPLFGMSFAGT